MILFVVESIWGPALVDYWWGSFLNLVLSVSLYVSPECQSKVLWEVFVNGGMCGMWVKRRRGYIMQTQSPHSYSSNSLESHTKAVWAIFPTMIMHTFGLKCRSAESELARIEQRAKDDGYHAALQGLKWRSAPVGWSS